MAMQQQENRPENILLYFTIRFVLLGIFMGISERETNLLN